MPELKGGVSGEGASVGPLSVTGPSGSVDAHGAHSPEVSGKPLDYPEHGEYVHQRLRSPSDFSELRTVKEGKHRIVVGKLKGSDKWEAQSILHPKGEHINSSDHGAHSPEVSGHRGADALALLLIAGGVVTLLSAEANVNGPTNPLNPLTYLNSFTGWSTADVSGKMSIAGREYWVTTWEAVCWGAGLGLLVVQHWCTPGVRVLAVLFGLAFLALGTTGFLFAWPFGS